MDETDIVDLRGIAALLGVSKHTPNQWRQRDALPEPDFPDLIRPVWYRKTIIDWARSTGRWPPGSVGRPDTRGPRPKPATAVPQPAKTPEPVKALKPGKKLKKAKGFRTAEEIRADIPPALFLPPPPPPMVDDEFYQAAA